MTTNMNMHMHMHMHTATQTQITGGNEAFSALSSVHQQQEESFETITAMNNGQLSQVTIVSFGGISTSQHEQKNGPRRRCITPLQKHV
jgi:hypothetical protein